MVITQVIHFVAYREKPARIAFRFFGNIICSFTGGEHLQPGPQKIIYPDCSFSAHHFIAKVQSTAEGPAHFKLADSAVLIFDKSDGMVLRIDWFYLCIRPAHYFNRLDIFSDKTPCNFNTMTTQVENTTAASLFNVPEPIAMRTGMRFS